MPKLRLLSTALPVYILFQPVNAYAEEAAAAHPLDAEIVVTALRTPVARDRVASSITVLDLDVIEHEQPITISDLLVRTPGISQSRNGGYGTATSLRIRGADSGQTVIVIDGMRLADPSSTAGGYNFANLLTGDIDRIEILRGPQSILWGSDAIGGVVNVQTARPTKKLEGKLAIEAGSRETANARAAIGGSNKLLDWRVAGSVFTTDGISARSIGTEADGYRRTSGSGTATIHLAENISADIRGYYADAHHEFDSFSGDSADYGLTREWTIYTGLNAAFLDGRFHNRFAMLHSETDRENYDPSRSFRSINFDAKGKVRRFEYQGRFEISPAADIVFGAEREEQRMHSGSPDDSSAAYALLRSKADIDSVYSQLRVTPFGGLTLSGGLRYDHHSLFGGSSVFSTGAAWSFNDGNTVLRASYDEGFKAPSLYQLYSLYGAANLDPEQAKGWEAGVEQALFDEKLRFSATYFHRDTDNLIDFAYCPTSGTLPDICFVPGTTDTRFGYYANVKQSRAQGVEISGAAQLGGFFVDANYSWIAAEDRSDGSIYGNQLARVPRHLANGQIGYEAPFGVKASVALRYSGKTRDSNSGSTWLDDYILTDIRAEWNFAPELTFFGRAENLFDVDYSTANGYSSLGRSMYFGLRGTF